MLVTTTINQKIAGIGMRLSKIYCSFIHIHFRSDECSSKEVTLENDKNIFHLISISSSLLNE
jgi:hypothetical protein